MKLYCLNQDSSLNNNPSCTFAGMCSVSCAPHHFSTSMYSPACPHFSLFFSDCMCWSFLLLLVFHQFLLLHFAIPVMFLSTKSSNGFDTLKKARFWKRKWTSIFAQDEALLSVFVHLSIHGFRGSWSLIVLTGTRATRTLALHHRYVRITITLLFIFDS